MTICVFCGSRSDVSPRYRDAATRLGTLLGTAGIDLVYGGGRIGLMGLLADAALAAEGRVIGVIPRFLDELEVAHDGLQELVVTETMHERKRYMYDRSDAFVSLPGGLGTFDETIEVITHIQLGLLSKPIVLVDIDGYWQPLLDLVRHGFASGFIAEQHLGILEVVDRPEQVIPHVARRWLERAVPVS